MPSFLAYCPDHAGILAKRLEVRAEHLKRAKEDDEAGIVGTFGHGLVQIYKY